jgi:hypothetical protein
MGEAYVGVHSLPRMGWLSRLFGRSGSVQEEPKTFEELEQEVQGQIAEDYAQKNVDAQSDVLSELDDDTLTEPKVEQSKVPVDFHVEKAEADDLLVDSPMEDHYTMAEGDAVDPLTADRHLAEAAASNSDLSGYEQVDVPVWDDDIEWQKTDE